MCSRRSSGGRARGARARDAASGSPERARGVGSPRAGSGMTDSSALYQEIILDHNRRPRNFRVLTDATVRGARRSIRSAATSSPSTCKWMAIESSTRVSGKRLRDLASVGVDDDDARDGKDASRGGRAVRAVPRARDGTDADRTTACLRRCGVRGRGAAAAAGEVRGARVAHAARCVAE